MRQMFSASTSLKATLGLAVGTAALIGAPLARADEIYGKGAQWLVISAAEFRANEPTCGLEYLSNYSYVRPSGCTGSWGQTYEYPLHLPEGARIYNLRLVAYDDDASVDISLTLNRATMTPYSGGPGSVNTYAAVANGTVATSGQQTYWQGPSASSLDHTFDTYDYGAPDYSGAAVFYSLRLTIPVIGTAMRVHSAHVYWQRQSAPAPASATFGDVPTSHPFFNDVQQLAKSGITSGCGGGNYCPDAAVTRGQMAAFLNRAFGLHWDWSSN